jgi:uncharacterized RDD family membrane protein YckC
MSTTTASAGGPVHHEHVVDPVPREARPYQGRRAGVVSRFVANTVDFVIVALVVAGGYFGLSALLFLWSPSSFTFPDTSWTVLLIAAGSVSFVYLTLSWATTGRTYGDHLLGLRVVNFRGERMHFAGAVARSAFCVVFPIGILYALVSRANRSVQDVLLRTSVIYDWGH